MAKKIDPKLIEILSQYGEDADEALWDCHGTWVAYHKAIERIAAKAGILYDTPQVLVSDRDAAAILVTGTLGDKTEWTIGEAAININYRVSGKQAAYPFAMAEKRAKDRVVLKLIGLHGLVYSEEESDDFEPVNEAAAPPPKSSQSLKRADANGEDAWDRLMKDLQSDLLDCKSQVSLAQVRADYRERAKNERWPRTWLDALANEFDKREDDLAALNHPVMAG